MTSLIVWVDPLINSTRGKEGGGVKVVDHVKIVAIDSQSPQLPNAHERHTAALRFIRSDHYDKGSRCLNWHTVLIYGPDRDISP
jgi:hypothetical protein